MQILVITGIAAGALVIAILAAWESYKLDQQLDEFEARQADMNRRIDVLMKELKDGDAE